MMPANKKLQSSPLKLRHRLYLVHGLEHYYRSDQVQAYIEEIRRFDQLQLSFGAFQLVIKPESQRSVFSAIVHSLK